LHEKEVIHGEMPVKIKTKSGKTKSTTFGKAVGMMKRRGYSAQSARKIVGAIYAKQKKGRK
jgi:hypothetical protein